jgi:hypothetical protein
LPLAEQEVSISARKNPPQSQRAFIPVREAGTASGNAEFFFFMCFYRVGIIIVPYFIFHCKGLQYMS